MGEPRTLAKLAQRLYRSPAEAARASSRDAIPRRLALMGLAWAVIVLLTLPAFQAILTQWARARMSVRLDSSQWKVLFASPSRPCGYDDHSVDCPANPAYPGWRQAFSRSEPDRRSRVRERGAREFWLQAQVSVAELHQAYVQRANVLYLGKIRGQHRLWLDGALYHSGSSDVYSHIAIPLPMARLARAEPLVITFEIANNIMSGNPDQLGDYGQGEGFLTPDRAASFELSLDYASRAPTLFFTVAHFILGAIFFFFWIVSFKKHEYFFVSLYSFVNSALALLLLDTMSVALTPIGASRAFMIMTTLKSAALLLLSFAFARLRASLSHAVIALAAVAAAVIFTYPRSVEMVVFSYSLVPAMVPIAAALALLGCAHQTYFLATSSGARSWHPARLRRMAWFSAGMAAIFVLSLVAVVLEPYTAKYNPLYQSADLLLIYVLGAVVFFDYREHQRQIETMPVSEYHKRPVLPARVAGALLTVDLKNSEPLYRARAEETGEAGLVDLWRTHVKATVLRCSGCVIGTRGDELTVLFDAEKTSLPPLAAAAHAAREIVRASQLLEEELAREGRFPKNATGLKCRIVVAEGEVRPTWETNGPAREPHWEEAGSSTPMVACARLLDLEKKFSGPGESTLVLLATAAHALGTDFSHRLVTGEDKHGHRYELALVTLDSQGQTQAPRLVKAA